MSNNIVDAFKVTALCIALVVAGYSAHAQFGGGGVAQTYVDNAITTMQSTVMAAMPQPANTAPVTDGVSASIGSQTNRYMLPDSVRPARYRSGQCTLASGVCSLTWSTPFATTPNPIGDPSVINTNFSSSMIQCNWTAVSTTGASFRCVQPLVTLSISLGALTLLPNATNGLVVSGTAVQPL